MNFKLTRKFYNWLAMVCFCAAMTACGSGSDVSVSGQGDDSVATQSTQSTQNAQALTASGNATLEWDAPTQRVDGTALQNIAGYKIYYGTSSGNYTFTADVNVASATSHQVQNLSPGEYFFVVVTIDGDGNVSPFSAEVSKIIL